MTQTATTTTRGWEVRTADTLTLLPELEESTVDAVITDPPYGIDFQHERWDGQQIRLIARGLHDRALTPGEAFECWTELWARELHRIVKPGGHIACFAAPRMAHRLTSGLENAGLEIRDVLMWLYSSGMPKSRRMHGGQGTALKPAYEPIVLARVPLSGTAVANHREWGTGTLNTQACEVRNPDGPGRWPANLCLTHDHACNDTRCAATCAVALLVRQAAASRFFFTSKASRRERDAGCHELPARRLDLFPTKGHAARRARNPHPTVKPLALMRWLARLACPQDGLILDPFCGSGSTGAAARQEHRRFLGIERDPLHARTARARITHWERRPHTPPGPVVRPRGARR